MNRTLRTAVLILIPLLAAAVAAQATPIFGTVTTSCSGGSVPTCSGSMSGGASGVGAAVLTASESNTDSTVVLTDATLQWYGTGSGSLTGLPITWDFLISPDPGSAVVSFMWQLEVFLNSSPLPTSGNGSLIYNSGVSSQSAAPQTIVGSANPAVSGTLGNWDVELLVYFTPAVAGNGVTITTQGNGIVLDPMPEPSTWSLAGGGLLFALGIANRKLRRR